MLGVIGRIVVHAELFHDPSRGAVAVGRHGHDFVEVEHVEPVVLRGDRPTKPVNGSVARTLDRPEPPAMLLEAVLDHHR